MPFWRENSAWKDYSQKRPSQSLSFGSGSEVKKIRYSPSKSEKQEEAQVGRWLHRKIGGLPEERWDPGGGPSPLGEEQRTTGFRGVEPGLLVL